MSIHIKNNDSWDNLNDLYIKINGQWVNVNEVYEKVDGTWELIFPAPSQGPTPDIHYSLTEKYDSSVNNQDGARPLSPQLQVNQDNESFLISWEVFNPQIVSEYEVFRAGSFNGNYTKVNSNQVTNTSYVDSSVNAGDIKFYKVRAITSQNVVTEFTSVVSGTLIEMTVDTNSPSVTTFPKYAFAKLNGELVSFTNVTTPIQVGFELKESGGNFDDEVVDSLNSTGNFSTKTEFNYNFSNSMQIDTDSSGNKRSLGGEWVESAGKFVFIKHNGVIELYEPDGTLVDREDSLSLRDRARSMDVVGTTLYVGYWTEVSDQTYPLRKFDLGGGTISLLNEAPEDVKAYLDIDVRELDEEIVVSDPQTQEVDIYDSNLSLIETLNQPDRINDVSYRNSDLSLAICRDGDLTVYNSDRSSQVFSTSGQNSEDMKACEFNNTGKVHDGYLAVGTIKARIEVYDDSFNFVGQSPPLGDLSFVHDLVWRPDGKIMIIQGNIDEADSENVFIYDINGNLVQEISTESSRTVQSLSVNNQNWNLLTVHDVDTEGSVPRAEIYEFESELDVGKSYEVRAFGKNIEGKVFGPTVTFST